MTATNNPEAQITAMDKAITSVRRVVFAITAITMLASYQHQVHVFTKNGSGWAGWILPAPLDFLVLALLRVSQLQGISPRNRMIARLLLLLPAGASAYINFMGEGTNLIKGTYAGLILAIVIGDLALSLIKLDPAVAQAIQAADAAAQAAAELTARRQAAAAKGAATRAANKTKATPKARTRKAHPVAAIQALTPQQIADAPVSPAPYGQPLVIAKTTGDIRNLAK